MHHVDTGAGDYVVAAAGTLALSGAALRDFLAAVLERGVPFRFTARGSSMHPFIKDADVITVTPLAGRALHVGQVVAYRGIAERLVVHRIVAIGAAGPTRRQRYLIRGDNCSEADGCVLPEAVLGVVTRVERAGRARRVGIGPEGVVLAGLSRAGVLRPAMKCAYAPRRAAAGALRRAQRVPMCRRVLRRLRPSFTVQRAVPADEAELARRFGLSADLRPRRGGVGLTGFIARLRGEHGKAGRIIGYVELVKRTPTVDPGGGFWIHSTMVATPYRGMGVAQALMRLAIDTAGSAGADDVQLTVDADNVPAAALYRKLGFVPAGSPDVRRQLNAAARRRIRPNVVLRLPLSETRAASGEVDS